MIGTRSAKVETPLGEDALLFLSMTAREALGQPFSYTVDVLAEDDTLDFASLLAFGVTLSIVLQVAVNVGVVLGCLPTKGLALPFLSYGGSAMIASLAYRSIACIAWA